MSRRKCLKCNSTKIIKKGIKKEQLAFNAKVAGYGFPRKIKLIT